MIHPERYPDDEPVTVTIPDRSSDEWEPATIGDGMAQTETVGEATIFGALWTNGAIDRPLTEGATTLSPYNYSAPETDGWAGDTFQVYHDTADENRTGHVWELAWESAADADEFAGATELCSRPTTPSGSTTRPARRIESPTAMPSRVRTGLLSATTPSRSSARPLSMISSRFTPATRWPRLR